jgi:formylglycine-generating enzyme required for sulfatase activity
VGRIRAWVAAARPTPRDGELLGSDGSGQPVRWQGTWKVQSEEQLRGWARYDTWSSSEERRPKNFLTWYTAAAFCHFDGGRLPTDAEWGYVAAGGDEQRLYPWGAEEPTPERAVFNCTGDGKQSCSLADILAVGSKPAGAGRWGHLDLAGSMFEWTLGAAAAASAAAHDETSRGGGFCYIGGVDRRATTFLKPSVLRHESAETTSHMVGARCAYSVP